MQRFHLVTEREDFTTNLPKGPMLDEIGPYEFSIGSYVKLSLAVTALSLGTGS